MQNGYQSIPTKIRPLVENKQFPMPPMTINSFKKLKKGHCRIVGKKLLMTNCHLPLKPMPQKRLSGALYYRLGDL